MRTPETWSCDYNQASARPSPDIPFDTFQTAAFWIFWRFFCLWSPAERTKNLRVFTEALYKSGYGQIREVVKVPACVRNSSKEGSVLRGIFCFRKCCRVALLCSQSEISCHYLEVVWWWCLPCAETRRGKPPISISGKNMLVNERFGVSLLYFISETSISISLQIVDFVQSKLYNVQCKLYTKTFQFWVRNLEGDEEVTEVRKGEVVFQRR